MSYLQPRPLLPASSGIPSCLVVKQKACVPCRSRKVKCDRKSPCSNCVSWKAQCVYPSPVRHCHRPSRSAKLTGDRERSELETTASPPLEGRLKALEETLTQLSVLVGYPNPSISWPAESTEGQHGNDFGSVKIETVNKLEDGVNEIAAFLLPRTPIKIVTGPESHTSPTSPIQFFHLDSDLDPLVPNKSQTKVLWQQFQQIADQQVKIVHRPQAELSLWRVCTRDVSIYPTDVALAFAIYFAALVGMSNDDIEVTFGMSKDTAVSTYQQAAEQAVMKANTLCNESLTTLQAMTVLAAFSRYVENDKKAWPITGMARRLNPVSSTAKGMAFEMEMRRRIWWQLWYLDYRATINDGEEAELGNIHQQPELPANVFDSELDPAMEFIPPSRGCWTPMSFSLMNFMIGQAATNVNRCTSWKQKRDIIDSCARKVQTVFHRHCSDSEPIHWLAKHVAYVHFTELRMKLYAQRNQQITTGQEASMNRNRLVMDVADILDVPNRLQKEPPAHKWKWTLSGFPHFTHLSFLFNEISQLQLLPPPSQIWVIAEQAFCRAQLAMSPSTKNKQSLQLSKKKAEEGIRLLLEWQRMIDEVENTKQVHAFGPEDFVDPYAGEVSMMDLLAPPASIDNLYGSFNSLHESDMGLDAARSEFHESTADFNANTDDANF